MEIVHLLRLSKRRGQLQQCEPIAPIGRNLFLSATSNRPSLFEFVFAGW